MATPFDAKLARSLAAEGTRIEADLIASGQKPVASMIGTGVADCKSVSDFVDRIYPQSVTVAEQSLIGALTSCPQTAPRIRSKVEAAGAQGPVPPRLAMAMIDSEGPASAWSQQEFERLFDSLPSPTDDASVKEAPNYAAMYATVAPKVSADIAKSTGAKFLAWLAKMDAVPERNLAVHISTDAMKAAIGADKYSELLRSDVMIGQLVQQASSGPQDITPPVEESASVLEAMKNSGTDQTEALKGLPPSMRAREAAADGFASGNSGDRRSANHYFDIAFTAADESWANRSDEDNLAPLIQEVCEAAAQVDPVAALSRAQRLQDPTEQAIGMLAVARVVSSKDLK